MGCCSSKTQEAVPPSHGFEMTAENCCQYSMHAGPFHVNRVDERRDIVFAADGPSSEKEAPAVALTALFKQACEKQKDKLAFAIEWPVPPKNADGSVPPCLPREDWLKFTWGDVYETCFTVAKFLVNTGSRFDGVVIFGANSPWWLFSELSAILGGMLPAGIYPTDTPEQLTYKCKYSNAVVACCDSDKVEVFRSNIDSTPDLKVLVVFGVETPEVSEIKRSDGTVVEVLSWDQMLAKAKALDDGPLNARLESIDARDVAALCFTSGTTGNPKAVMLSHDNLAYQARTTLQCVPDFGLTTVEKVVSYLPLSHVAGQIVDLLVPLICSAERPHHTEVYFTRVYDLKSGSLGDRLRFVKPTTFLGVPRVWEKIADKIKAKGAQTKGLKRKIAIAAKRRGLEYEQNKLVGGSGIKPGGYDFYNKLVLQKVKQALGFDNLRFAITGAAPMPKELQVYFAAFGININNSYGMSECGGATTVNVDHQCLWGTVGSPLPGSEVRIFKTDDSGAKIACDPAQDLFNPTEAEQGEICYRGRHIMLGYYANPKLGEEHVQEIEKKNLETIDSEGYLHSGDKGCVGTNHFFCITGRYKELIIGAGGENIAPVPIEDDIKNNFDGISNIVMIGDQRKFNVALVTLKAVGATGELAGTDEIDPDVLKHGDAKTIQEALKDQKWISAIEGAIKKTNATGSVCHSNAFKIQKFTILHRDLSIEGGEFTPTLKLKRAVVDKKYMELINAMYDSSTTYFECTPELMPALQLETAGATAKQKVHEAAPQQV